MTDQHKRNLADGSAMRQAHRADVRALRIYKAAGLLAPRRTENNWRLYGAQDLARLTEILTLKRLGLTLEQTGSGDGN